MSEKWYEKFITEDETGGWIAWDERQYDAIGYYATKAEAILAVLEYAKRLKRDQE